MLHKDLLRYGEIKSDDMINAKEGFYRLRVIRYNDKIYMHKMFNGEVIACFEV